MKKLYYCVDCKRIFEEGANCEYCKSEDVKELVRNSPVNVIGSKIKGRVLKIEDGVAQLLIQDENNNKLVKHYEASKIRKVL